MFFNIGSKCANQRYWTVSLDFGFVFACYHSSSNTNLLSINKIYKRKNAQLFAFTFPHHHSIFTRSYFRKNRLFQSGKRSYI